ncbi:MAG: hypothetical protein H7A24_13295 [Leptospiraceae bacterium]|nr:hypothetical protein [Leptospiraceae bacterium]MCP5512853.1 hypothetical protein [Leptospiraceae bacterium]
MLLNCSMYQSKQPVASCYQSCRNVFLLCYLAMNSNNRDSTGLAYDNATILAASCNITNCYGKCDGQGLATFQQNSR